MTWAKQTAVRTPLRGEAVSHRAPCFHSWMSGRPNVLVWNTKQVGTFTLK